MKYLIYVLVIVGSVFVFANFLRFQSIIINGNENPFMHMCSNGMDHDGICDGAHEHTR